MTKKMDDFSPIFGSGLDWQSFNNKTILITGSNGFIPGSFVKFFLALSDCKKINLKVLGLAKTEGSVDHPRFKTIIQDVSSPINIEEPVHTIIHGASRASPLDFFQEPTSIIKPNLLGTINLLEFAEKSPLDNFIFLSSGTIYGQFNDANTLLNEETYGSINPFDNSACYSLSKKMAETICYSWFREKNTPVKICRLAHTLGTHMKLGDGRVHHDFIQNIITGESFKIKGDGTSLRSFIDINDLITAVIFVILKGKPGEAYNLSNPENEISIKDFAHLLKSLSNNQSINIDIQNNPDSLATKSQRYNMSINKLKSLGWSPKINIEESLKKILKAYES